MGKIGKEGKTIKAFGNEQNKNKYYKREKIGQQAITKLKGTYHSVERKAFFFGRIYGHRYQVTNVNIACSIIRR